MERNFQLRRELLAEVEAVAPTLAAHAADSEGLARLNPPSIEALRKTERKLAEDDARPMIFYGRIGTCCQPQVKGYTVPVNSIYNNSRLEDVWLDN